MFLAGNGRGAFVHAAEDALALDVDLDVKGDQQVYARETGVDLDGRIRLEGRAAKVQPDSAETGFDMGAAEGLAAVDDFLRRELYLDVDGFPFLSRLRDWGRLPVFLILVAVDQRRADGDDGDGEHVRDPRLHPQVRQVDPSDQFDQFQGSGHNKYQSDKLFHGRYFVSTNILTIFESTNHPCDG